MNSIAMEYHNPTVVRNAGISALKKELGIVGTSYFLRQFGIGKGDYTAEREQVFQDTTSDDIVEGIRVVQRMRQIQQSD